MKTSQKIKKYLKENDQATAYELYNFLDISSRAVRKQLLNLLKKGEVSKKGKPPKVFYFIPEKNLKSDEVSIFNKKAIKFINQNYIYITPSGELLEGIEAFEFWCQKTNQPLAKTADDYIKTLNKYYQLRRNGFINGISKLKNTFKKVGLNSIFYLDFYSIDRFGKTKLGQTLLYAKQSQNLSLIKNLIKEIRPEVDKLINKYEITSIGYIPPSVKREVQLMKVLEKNLKLNLTKINLVKIQNKITVPQKTLTKLEDRIENAKTTIVVDDTKIHKNILLIDDAVGSGSTLNETALQIKRKKICKGKIIGLAITGSYKGFDVISEV